MLKFSKYIALKVAFLRCKRFTSAKSSLQDVKVSASLQALL